MNNIINQDYTQAKTTLSKKQESAANKIIKKEGEIENIKKEISLILQENDLNILDINEFKNQKKVQKFIDYDFST